MKKVLPLIFSLFLLGCWQKAYHLSDENNDRDYLIDYIKKLKKDGTIKTKPLLVLNGAMIPYDSLQKCNLVLFRKDIDSIYAIFKKNDKGALAIYGEESRNGVVLIKVKKYHVECN